MAEYITREAAYEKCGWYNTVNGKSVCAARKDELAAIPAADVAPVVHGRWDAQKYWKYENKHSIQYHTNRCSLCHCDVSSRLLYNYCPNCGARMDGE
jgi:hypothetical protein